MGNEMGNQNAAGIKEENEATNAKENVQGLTAPENDLKGENHIKPEGESKEYHEKAGELSNHDKEAAIDSEIKLFTSNEKEEDKREPKPPPLLPEVVSKEELDCEANVEDEICKSEVVIHEKKPSTEKDQQSEAQESADDPTEAAGDDDSSSTDKSKENNHLIYAANPQNHIENVVPEDVDHCEEEKRVDLEDKSVVIDNLEEKCDMTSYECKELIAREMKLTDSSVSKLEDVPQPNDNSKLEPIARESENGENDRDLLSNEDSGHSALEEIDHTEESKVISKVNQIGLADNNVDSLSQALVDTEDVIEMEQEVRIPTEISNTTANNGDEKATEEATMESDDEGKDKSYITGNGSDSEGTLDKNRLQFESSEKENCLYIAPHDASDVNANDAIRELPASGAEMKDQEAEREQKIHSIPETIAETELPPEKPHEQYAINETSIPFAGVVSAMPESVGRHSIESNPEKSCDRIELRKCPSFDFGIPIDARSEESDQTPLLRHDKTVFRSLSSCSNMTFHSANGRSSLDYDQVVAEEKTIRMERSDSDNTRAPSFNLIKKEDVNKSAIIHVASKNLTANELEISSPRGTGKRKAKSSFFTTCLCCTAAIS